MSKKISLNVKCPHCQTSLMDADKLINEKPSIKLNIETTKNRGTIRLCSVYECYDKISDLKIQKKEIVNFYCPHCNKELISNDKCDSCDAQMVSLVLALGGKVYFCSREGCVQHSLSFQNLDLELKKFYHEYGY